MSGARRGVMDHPVPVLYNDESRKPNATTVARYLSTKADAEIQDLFVVPTVRQQFWEEHND